ncbi:MAG: VCBS repeat-containing protein [Gammaproteobacteria bacterium]|nr:VCBS repeat-containing protein [Gammaproteobacteria bacterium]
MLGVLGILASGGGGGDVIPAFTLYTGIAIADLNGDTKLDLATSNVFIGDSPPHPSHVSVSLQQTATPGVFEDALDYPVGADSEFVVAGDLNNDGFIDLLATNYNGDSVSLLEQSQANGGVFLPERVLTVAQRPDGCVLADINGDGIDDIVTTGSYLTILLNTLGNPGNFSVDGTINTSTYLPSIGAGDIDGDGRVDLVATDITNGTVLVLLQDAAPAPRGNYSGMTAYSAGDQPIDVELADVDGDLKLDLVVANLGTPSDPDTASVAILIQNHDPLVRGEFLPAVGYATDARSQDVAVGDLNDDNLPDIAVANAGHLNDTGSISILLQGSTPGVFLSADNITGISQPLALAIGDLNDDGFNDIAVADNGAVVFFQDTQGPGSFQPAVLIDP